MVSPSRGKIGRNDPCACGSGKKYKHCCLSAQSVSDDSPWKRQREASDRLTDEMQRFARREFMEDFLDAWEDFNQTPFPIPYGKPRLSG
ncbi:MAG: SEC-C metal-binding domain-containing protein [Acidobacteriaceae bacterium]